MSVHMKLIKQNGDTLTLQEDGKDRDNGGGETKVTEVRETF